jgi:hypothetical protein
MLVAERKRLLNVVCNENGDPIAVSDADSGLDAATIFLGRNDQIEWQSLDDQDFTVEFKQGFGQPFADWDSTKKKGKSVLGKIKAGQKGKRFPYSILIEGKAPFDPAIIIER